MAISFFCILPSFTHAQTTGGVSLLYEADSYTPQFYRGRALPSANTPVRVYADANTLGKPESLSYAWSINGRVMQNISGVGKNYIVLPGPVLFGALVVSVTVSGNGKAASITTRIGAETPILDLYEDNALTGKTIWNALGNGEGALSSKATIVAEPFFFAEPISSKNIHYLWAVGGLPAAADPGKPNTITISATSTRNLAIELQAKHSIFTLETAARIWNLVFSSGGASGFVNQKF